MFGAVFGGPNSSLPSVFRPILLWGAYGQAALMFTHLEEQVSLNCTIATYKTLQNHTKPNDPKNYWNA